MSHADVIFLPAGNALIKTITISLFRRYSLFEFLRQRFWRNFQMTRKHSSRMCTTHLPTARILVSATRCQYELVSYNQGDGYTMGLGMPIPPDILAPPLLSTYPPPSPGHTHPNPLDIPTPCWWHLGVITGDIPTHSPLWTIRHLWKLYLPTTSFAVGKNEIFIQRNFFWLL